MEYIVTALYIAAFLYVITRLPLFRTTSVSPRAFAWIFVLKVASGIALGLLYRYYFNGGDTHIYFENAMIMHSFIYEDVGVYIKMLFASGDPSLKHYYDLMLDWDNLDYFYNDSHTIVRLNALLRLVSFGIYDVHVVFFSFFSLFGLACLYKCFLYFLPGNQKALLWIVFLVPSVMFWSSGILKEGLLMFGLGVLFYSKLQMIHNGKAYYVVPALFAMVMLLFLKVYVLLLLFPGIVAWIWAARSPAAISVLKFVIVYFTAMIVLMSARLINPNLSLAAVIHSKQASSVYQSELQGSRSKINPPKLNNSMGSLVFHSPAAFFKALTQPLPSQAHNPFAAMAAAENSLLVLVLLISLIFSKKPPNDMVPFLLVCAFFTILLFILIGYTTATAGNLVRYKMPALPFLLFVCVALFDPRRLKQLFGIKRS